MMVWLFFFAIVMVTCFVHASGSILTKGNIREEISSLDDVHNTFDEFLVQASATQEEHERKLLIATGEVRAGPRGDPGDASPQIEPTELSFMIVSFFVDTDFTYYYYFEVFCFCFFAADIPVSRLSNILLDDG
jgi:hypothetical protein